VTHDDEGKVTSMDLTLQSKLSTARLTVRYNTDFPIHPIYVKVGDFQVFASRSVTDTRSSESREV
jgi:hypothetical protein